MQSGPSKVYPSIPPLLYSEDVQASIEFYKHNLGWEERLTMPGPDGQKVIHAMLGRGENNLLLGEQEAIKYTSSPQSEDSVSEIYFHITRIDDYYREVCAKEDTLIIRELADQDWGDRTFTVRDNNGYIITFAEHVHDEVHDGSTEETPVARS